VHIRELITRRSLVCCVLAWVVPSYASVIVQLKVIEGEGTVYRTGTRATRGLTVLVTDETGKPVANAAVSFRLPEDGPGGVFNSGLRTEVITTGADGKATVWGMQWNKNAGPVEIRITAVKDQARAGLISTQYLSDSVAPKAGGEGVFSASHKGRMKWILIAAGVGAGAAAGLLFARSNSSAPPGSTTSNTGILIGSPSINIGHP
jgi:hypothetical protein